MTAPLTPPEFPYDAAERFHAAQADWIVKRDALEEAKRASVVAANDLSAANNAYRDAMDRYAKAMLAARAEVAA